MIVIFLAIPSLLWNLSLQTGTYFFNRPYFSKRKNEVAKINENPLTKQPAQHHSCLFGSGLFSLKQLSHKSLL